MKREDNPTWDIYDLWRTARLNTKYYSHQLQVCIFWNGFFDVISAITAPSGGVAALFFWNTAVGAVLWKILISIAAVSSILKPIFGFTDKIMKMETVLSGYRLLEHDTGLIINKLRQKQKYDSEIVKQFDEANKRKGILVTQCPEVKDNYRLRTKFADEVAAELKTYEYFIPEAIDV